MRKRRFRVWIWILSMAGVVFLMVQVVNQFRGNRGENQISKAYELLDQGELSQGIAQLEEAKRTFDLIDESFPARDTLYGLYLRTQNWENGYNLLMSMHYSMSTEDWMKKATRFTLKARHASEDYARWVADDMLSEDPYLQLYEYPASLDSLLGATMGERMIRNEYYDGFMRMKPWCTADREWWYYVADDGEEVDFQRFGHCIRIGFQDRKEVVVDLFQPIRGPKAYDYGKEFMGFSRRVVFSGSGLQDSSYLSVSQLKTDSLDTTGGRWRQYIERQEWESELFYWNTVMLSRPVQEPYYLNMPYLILREIVRSRSKNKLLDIAAQRGLLVQNDLDFDCETGREANCWTLEPYWLEGMPQEFIDLWKQQFPMSAKIAKEPNTALESKEMALAQGLNALD